MSRPSTGQIEQRVRVLVVEHRPGEHNVLRQFLSAWNFEPLFASTEAEALELVSSRQVSLVIISEPAPGMRGIDLVRALKQSSVEAEAILLAEEDSAAYATEAFRAGAYNCLRKPVDFKQLSGDLNMLRQALQERQERKLWEPTVNSGAVLDGMVGFSAPMQAVFASLRRYAQDDSPVLITGLIGTGKELAANALHRLSTRAKQPLIIYRCCGVGETMARLELFGQLGKPRTAAPNANAIVAAQGGSLLLDEVGDLPTSIQVLIRSVVASEPGEKARVLATTRMNLAEMAAQGRFDTELHSLLSRNVVHLPSLSERVGDIPLLARHFLAASNREYGKNVAGFTSAAQRVLLSYAWPGNVRELENVIGRACLLADNGQVDVSDLSIASAPSSQAFQEYASSRKANGAAGWMPRLARIPKATRVGGT